MNPEQQRIAIAEACGWKPDDDGDGTGWKGSRIHQRLIGKKPTFRYGKVVSYLIEQTVPNYLNDLNAMHEAEGMLGDKWMPYARLLLEITTGCGPAMPLGFLNAATLCSSVHATASQRAEAFLRTIGKWEEAK